MPVSPVSEGKADSDTRNEREARFHNDIAEGVTTDRPRTVGRFYAIRSGSAALYRKLCKTDCAGQRILEYGCGRQGEAVPLAKAGASVTAIDIADKAIEVASEIARQAGATVEYRVMDAQNLAFPEGSFDRVVGVGILHHLDLARAFTEISRVLKPSGRAVFTEPLGHNPLINWFRRRTPDIRTPDEHPLMMADLQLARCFFGQVDVHFSQLTSLAAIPFYGLPGFRLLVRTLDGLDQVIFRLLPFTRRYAWCAILVLSQPERRSGS